jgi:hypothetical protein
VRSTVLGKTEGTMRQIMRDQDVDAAFSSDLALVYKHSPT